MVRSYSGRGRGSCAKEMTSSKWTSVLELDPQRSIRAGSDKALCDAIRRGADLKILTDFHHNEHIDTSSSSNERITETSEFHLTYLVEDRWTAAFMTLRQPVVLPHSFGTRPSMSCFMYNQDGHQAIARMYLDGPPIKGGLGPSPALPPENMPKYHALEAWDGQSNGPSMNFIYDFDVYKFYVRDDWEEVLHTGPDGETISGSIDALGDAFSGGKDVKVGVKGVCDDLASEGGAVEHEVFIQTGFNYYYTEKKLFMAETHPVIRCRAAIPMWYVSKGWDFGWLFVRTDGFVERLVYDPYTLENRKIDSRQAIRWFVRG